MRECDLCDGETVMSQPLAALEHSASDIDANLEPTAAQVVAGARDWAREFVSPLAETWERERRFATEAFSSAASQGLTGLMVPEADGGAGLNQFGLARVLEEIAAVDFAVAFVLVCHNNLANAVSRRAPEQMRQRALPQLVSGESVGAFLLTEPEVGSDASAISVSATPTSSATASGDGGGDWVLNGTKAWITNGAVADYLSVYVQTDQAKGHRGIAVFLVDAANKGVSRQDDYELLGGHAMGTNSISFDDCLVGEADLFIPVGAGFSAAMSGIDLARTLVSCMCCGMLRTALEVAVSYVKERQAFGGRIADLQGVRFILADVATDLEATRALAYRAAAALSAGEPGGAIAASHAKKFATQVAERRIADCMQVMGANGAKRDHPLPRHLAAARLTNYLDGATEIQNVVLSRALLD